MSLPRVKTPLNAHLYPKVGEINTKPSLTVPDQSLSMREILDRYANGLPLGGVRTPLVQDVEGDDYYPDPRTLDLSERQLLARQFEEEYKELKRKEAEQKADIEAKKAEKQRSVDEALAFYAASKAQAAQPSTNPS